MTIKEATLQSLDDMKKPSTYKEIYNNIESKEYYNFGKTIRPTATVSAMLGDFIRNNDTRVKRIGTSAEYRYYLEKYKDDILFEELIQKNEIPTSETYSEKDLHKLLSSYLKNEKIYSKTIPHEESKIKKDKHQKWIHPDMIGVKTLHLDSIKNKAFMKTVNNVDRFSLTSYEIKREINTDYELKEAYFQAVSNSSWSNYGYLVAFEISGNLKDEIERLNQSFGIGVINLKAKPFQSQILFQAKFRELDFKTIDKLCVVNEKYEEFIELIERVLTIDERNYKSIKKELNDFSDNYFTNDSEIETYCKEHHIPIDDSDIPKE